MTNDHDSEGAVEEESGDVFASPLFYDASVGELYPAVIVAMIFVGVMQVAVDHVVDMVSMGNRLMSAAGAVPVCGIVGCTFVAAGAVRGIGGADLEMVFVDMAFMERVQMAIMEVIGVPVVENGCMATRRAVLMRVIFVNIVLLS